MSRRQRPALRLAAEKWACKSASPTIGGRRRSGATYDLQCLEAYAALYYAANGKWCPAKHPGCFHSGGSFQMNITRSAGVRALAGSLLIALVAVAPGRPAQESQTSARNPEQ